VYIRSLGTMVCINYVCTYYCTCIHVETLLNKKHANQGIWKVHQPNFEFYNQNQVRVHNILSQLANQNNGEVESIHFLFSYRHLQKTANILKYRHPPCPPPNVKERHEEHTRRPKFMFAPIQAARRYSRLPKV